VIEPNKFLIEEYVAIVGREFFNPRFVLCCARSGKKSFVAKLVKSRLFSGVELLSCYQHPHIVEVN